MDKHPLRRYRAEQGVSATGMALRADTSRGTIHRIESRTLAPSLKLVKRILRASNWMLRADDFIEKGRRK